MTACDSLKVDVPVGTLLTEARDILVSIDRVDEAPLSIRLRLIPDEPEFAADLGATPDCSANDTPMPMRRLTRRKLGDDHNEDLGGSD
jgi:hypothetical protein